MNFSRCLYSVVLLSSLLVVPARAADIILINLDPPGQGLNDPTEATPVGGNPGLTVGEQRQNVYFAAAQKWGDTLQSTQLIFVGATFQPLPCEAQGGVLGSAGPIYADADFEGAPLPNTWYVAALADALAVDGDRIPGELDLISFFNSDLGTEGCLENSGWYYGLDNNNDPAEIDFLSVVTHEIAHGLGFLELVSEADGTFFFGIPDAYARNMYDRTFGTTWDNLTDEERLISQVNSGNLAWLGESVTTDSQFVLGARPSVQISAKKKKSKKKSKSGDVVDISGSYEAQAASYGPPLVARKKKSKSKGKGQPKEDELILVYDGEDNDGTGSVTDGCEPIRNKIKGKIALIDRGGCTFTQKTTNAQNAGAEGVIVVNNEPGGLPSMGGADDPFFEIPSVGVSQADGTLFKDAAAEDKTKATLLLDEDFIAGTTPEGLVRLYAPNPVQPGSSKSHFDTTATPNLLMEPAITDDLMPSVFLDLTPNLFEDIGWVLQ